MPGDLDQLPAPAPSRARRGPGVLAGELLGRVRAELPVAGIEEGPGELINIAQDDRRPDAG